MTLYILPQLGLFGFIVVITWLFTTPENVRSLSKLRHQKSYPNEAFRLSDEDLRGKIRFSRAVAFAFGPTVLARMHLIPEYNVIGPIIIGPTVLCMVMVILKKVDDARAAKLNKGSEQSE